MASEEIAFATKHSLRLIMEYEKLLNEWKLVAKGEKGPWELYDMEADRTEMHDIAGDHPERMKEMMAAWRSWADRTNVYPNRKG